MNKTDEMSEKNQQIIKWKDNRISGSKIQRVAKKIDAIIIQIIQKLLELYDCITIDELSERVGRSPSSIRHRMNEVRNVLGVYGIEIINVPKKGIRLEASEAQRKELKSYLYKYLFSTPESEEYRKNYILNTLFEYSDNYTIQLFAEELFVSKKTISKDLRTLESELNRFFVKLVIRRNSGVSVEGNEFDVRQAMISHNNGLWWDAKYIDKPDEVDPRISLKAWTYMNLTYGNDGLIKWQRELLQAEKMIGIVWTDITFARLFEYIVVTAKRIYRRWMITEPSKDDLLPVNVRYLTAARWLMEQIAGNDSNEWEENYMAARFYVGETIDFEREHAENALYRETVKDYLSCVGMAVSQQNFSEDELLCDQLCAYLSKLRYRENYRIIDWNDLNQEIRQNVSDLFGVCFTYIYILEQDENLVFRQDDIARITLLINNHVQIYRRKAIFVTATDEATTLYQMGKLKKQFPKLNFIKAVHFRDFDWKSCEDELIISTVCQSGVCDNCIRITKHVSEQDVAHIEEELEQSGRPRTEDWYGLFDRNLMWEINARDKKDAISQICEKLQETGYVTEGFEDAVWRREKITPTCLGNGIAIPHVFRECIRQECIAVAKLKHTVLWDRDNSVNLIFLIALKDQIVQMPQFFAEFYSIFSDEQALEEIQNIEGIYRRFRRNDDIGHS